MGAVLVGVLYLLLGFVAAVFIAFVAPGGCVVLAILAIARWRRSRVGWRIAKTYFWGLALWGLCCLPLILAGAVGAANGIAMTLYHYQLDAPRILDGVVFPAGSEVQLSPVLPHPLLGGTLGAPATIGGLRIVDAFTMRGGEVEIGTLAEPRQIDILPCAAGQFVQDPNSAGCVLARAISVGGLQFAAGIFAWVTPASLADKPIVHGTLAASAHVAPFDCAPGVIDASEQAMSCVLAGDQTIDGYRLRGGTTATIGRQAESTVSSGVLAGPLDMAGVVLPPGTRIDDLPPGPAVGTLDGLPQRPAWSGMLERDDR